MSFTFTKGTREILTSFSKINSGIVLDPLAETHIVGQNAIRTISSDGDDAIFAVATVPEVFNQSASIVSIKDFVRALDQYSSPTVNFTSEYADISQDGTSSRFTLSSTSVLSPTGSNPTIASEVVASISENDISRIRTEIANAKAKDAEAFSSELSSFYSNLGDTGADYSSVPSFPSTAEEQQSFIGSASEINTFQTSYSSSLSTVNSSLTPPSSSTVNYEVAFEIDASPLSVNVYVTRDRVKTDSSFRLSITTTSSSLSEDNTLYIPIDIFDVLLSGLDYNVVMSTVDQKIQFFANHIGSQTLSDVSIQTPNLVSSVTGDFTSYSANQYVELVSNGNANDGYYRISEISVDGFSVSLTKPFVSTESNVEYTIRIPTGYFYYENTYSQTSFDTALSTYQSAQDTYNGLVTQYETDFETYSQQKSLDIRANDELLLDAKLAIRDDKLVASPAGGGTTNYVAPTAIELANKLGTSPYDQYSSTYEQEYDTTGNGNPSGSNPRPVEPEFTESAPTAGGNEVTFSSSLSYWLPATLVTGLIPTS